MDPIQAIKTRRSVRQYKDKDVSSDLVKQLLEAAMSAPSAYNHQPWQFIVLTDRKILNRVALIDHCVSAGSAAVAILVCGDFQRETEESFLIQGCSAATENMLIAANALGLGAVWTSIFPFKDAIKNFRDMLGLPKNILPITLVPIGYPNQKTKETIRFDEKRIHYNGW